jgi:hypothetical protein
MNTNDFDETEAFILNVLEKARPNLDKESIDAVIHYVHHNELEMAFEGLFLEIINRNLLFSINIEQADRIGKSLKLNEESVYDSEFWTKFQIYLKKYNS